MPSVSKAQQRFFKIVHAYKVGDIKPSDIKSEDFRKKISRVSKSMSLKDIEDMTIYVPKKKRKKKVDESSFTSYVTSNIESYYDKFFIDLSQCQKYSDINISNISNILHSPESKKQIIKVNENSFDVNFYLYNVNIKNIDLSLIYKALYKYCVDLLKMYCSQYGYKFVPKPISSENESFIFKGSDHSSMNLIMTFVFDSSSFDLDEKKDIISLFKDPKKIADNTLKEDYFKLVGVPLFSSDNG